MYCSPFKFFALQPKILHEMWNLFMLLRVNCAKTEPEMNELS